MLKINTKQVENNILAMFSEATEIEISEGLSWYNRANLEACKMAEQFNLPVYKVAGIISALSPAVSWTQNLADTKALLNGLKLGHERDVKVSTYGPNKNKAIAIYHAENKHDVHNLLVGSSNTINKTASFYKNILDPTSTEHVTIDRHAVRVALDEILKDSIILTEHRYKVLSNCYMRAAKRVNLRPHELQAITWLTFRRALLDLENVPF